MKKDSDLRFVGLMEMLCAAFRVDPTDPLIEGYWMALEDLNLNALESAFRQAIQQCQHLPRPVELRLLAGVRSPQQQAIDAWPEVLRAASGSGTISDPIAQEAVRQMGGIKRLGQTNEAELQLWGRKEFERLYIDAHEKAANLKRLPYPIEPLGELTEG